MGVVADELLPVHPVTGLKAIGFTSRGPVWPVLGGSEDSGSDSGAGDSGDSGGDADGGQDSSHDDVDERPAPSFKNYKEFQDFLDSKIRARVARVEKKYAPIVEEHGKLKTKVEEWEPKIKAAQTDEERRDNEMKALLSEVEELRSFKKRAERNDLVREIAEEKGLPARFVPRVQGDTPDDIAADIDSLLEALGESAKGTPKSKQQKPRDEDGGQQRKLHAGSGSGDDLDSFDPKKLAAEIPRWGQPYIAK